MKEIEAIQALLTGLKDSDIALFTTGMVSREAQSIKDRPQNFYMIGSMGLASSVGLGIALNTNKKVIVFDGDGSVLMDMGTMALIASEKPKNLIHLVIDNESYKSTGCQPTISRKICLDKIAKAAGYKTVKRITNLKTLKKSVSSILKAAGPAFILLKVKGEETEPPRVKASPEELKNRIMKSLRGVK